MAVSESYLGYVLEQLGRVQPVTWRRMFGGVGLYADGVFFAVIDNNLVFFRSGDGNRSEYEQRGMAPFQPMGPDTKPMAYHELPEEVLENPTLLAEWMTAAIEEAKKAQRRKPAKLAMPSKRVRSRSTSRRRGRSSGAG